MFTPVGIEARWKIVHHILAGAAIGETVTYEKLGEALELNPDNPRERQIIQHSVLRATKELEVVNKHTVNNQPGKGYVIADGHGHLVRGEKQSRKANKALVRGHSAVVNVDFNEIKDPVVKQALENTARIFGAQIEFNTRIAKRLNRQEQAIRNLRNTTEGITDEHEDRLKFVEKILAEHGLLEPTTVIDAESVEE